MARANVPLVVFNRGLISNLGLARIDLDRTRLSAETQTNFIPRTLGSMMLRPGLEYIGEIRNSSTARLVEFIFSSTDTALTEFTSTSIRAWIPSTNTVAMSVVTRANSTSTITLGDFSSTLLGGWTDADEAGATSEWFTGDYLSLVGTRYARAIRRQTITAASGSHGLSVRVNRGRVLFKVGSSAGGDDYFNERTLRPGHYSLLIESTGDFVIEFSANTEYRSLVDSVSIESSGDMVLDSTYDSSDLSLLRWDQSGDVIFLAANGYKQKRLERYGQESWALAEYEPQDGPFRGINVTNKRLTPSGLSGNITLSCDQPLFKSGHEGALFRLTSVGQQVTITPSGTDQWSDAIRVSGVDETRIFDVLVESSTGFDATVRVQRSVGEEGSWANVSGLAFTSTISTAHDDELDNQIIFYRIGVGSTFVSGSPECTLTYAAGGLTGVARIDSVVSATESSASVLTNMGSTTATELWEEGSWSDFRGWPSAVVIHEGRLWFAGKAKIWGSVSDDYESFDPDVEGDSGPLNRSLGSGPIDQIQWMESLGRLILGADSREIQAKTSSLEEPLTPTNFNLRDISTQGSAGVQAGKVDKRLLFVQQAGVRVMEMGYSGDTLDYETADRTIVVPEIGEPRLSRIAVQRQPDTRVHCVRGSTTGTVAMLVSDPAEDVAAWVDVESSGKVNGIIEDAAVLPSTNEDAVFYLVKREINGSTKRYLERWATELEARGGSRVASALFKITGGSSDGSITGVEVEGTDILGQDVSFETSSSDTALELVNNINGAWALANGTYGNVSYNVDPITGAGAKDFFIKPDGTRAFVVAVDGSDETVYQFTLLTPWKVDTAVYDGKSFTQDAAVGTLRSMTFSADGLTMFFIIGPAYRLYQFNLDVAWEITTASDSGNTFDLFDQDTLPTSIFFDNTGKRAFVTGNTNDTIYRYSLTTAWDISSMSYASDSFDFTDIDKGPTGIFFRPDGFRMFVAGGVANKIFQVDLVSAWDLSTAVYNNVSFDHSNEFTATAKLFFGRSGTRMYLTEVAAAGDDIYQYNVAKQSGIIGRLSADDPEVVVLEDTSNAQNNGDEVVIKTSGDITIDERVFFSGKRTLLAAGGTVPADNKMADSFIAYNTTSQTTFGATHLIGSSVVAWGNGKDLGTYTVDSTGGVTLTQSATSVVIGLPYTGIFRSAKLAYAAQAGTALTQRKRVSHLGLVLSDVHAQGLEYGPSTDRMDPMPRKEGEATISTDLVHDVYDHHSIPFNGTWDTDSRIVLVGKAPRPVTVLGAVIQIDTKEKI